MVITTKDINGEDIKVLVDDYVGRFIKMYALIEKKEGKQKACSINGQVFTFEGDEIEKAFSKTI